MRRSTLRQQIASCLHPAQRNWPRTWSMMVHHDLFGPVMVTVGVGFALFYCTHSVQGHGPRGISTFKYRPIGPVWNQLHKIFCTPSTWVCQAATFICCNTSNDTLAIPPRTCSRQVSWLSLVYGSFFHMHNCRKPTSRLSLSRARNNPSRFSFLWYSVPISYTLSSGKSMSHSPNWHLHALQHVYGQRIHGVNALQPLCTIHNLDS